MWRNQAHPQHPWFSIARESAKAAYDDLKWFELSRRNFDRCPDNIKAGGRRIAEELQGKMNVASRNPPHKVRADPIAQFHDCRFNSILKRHWQFNGEKASEHAHVPSENLLSFDARAGRALALSAGTVVDHGNVGCTRRKIAQVLRNGNPGKDSEHRAVRRLSLWSCRERTGGGSPGQA